MTTRKPLLGSAACLLLLGAMIAAAPVLAQSIASTNPNSPTAQNDSDDVPFHQRLLMPNVPATLVRLEDVPNVNDELFNMPVIDAAGYRVGHFRRVETKMPDYVVAVVTLNGSRRTIALLTDHVRYEPNTRLIIADITGLEMDHTPSEVPSSWMPRWDYPYG
jgi:hypothetical protein